MGTRPKKNQGNDHEEFETPNWTSMNKSSALDANCNECRRKGQYAKTCDKDSTTITEMTTERGTDEPNEP